MQGDYERLGEYYGTAIMPARVRQPKDKASAEGSVRIIATAIMARLRNSQYSSFDALKYDISIKLKELNSTVMEKKGISRADALKLEATSLQPLPVIPFSLKEWKYEVKVAPNSHISYKKNFYSVPYTYIGQSVSVFAYFLVCLKANQGELFDVIEEAFSMLDVDKFQGEVLSSSRTSTEHGRIETKDISILNAEDILSTELERKWPHVHSAIRVRTSRIYKSSSVQTEDREDKFFISFITPDGLDDSFAATMQDIILSRWQIESRHWVIDVVFGQDALPLRNKEYIENSTVYTKIACNVLSYIRDHVPYYNGKPCSFESLQILARKAQTNFMFLKAFFTKDMSEIENDERFIGIFYKEPEPTGNDVPDNLEVTGYENQVDDSFKLANLVRRSSKLKSKRKLR